MTVAASRSWLGHGGLGVTLLLLMSGPASAQRGRIQMENGDPPPQPVLVKALCSTVGTRTLGNGGAVTTSAQGYTDADGNFNLSANLQNGNPNLRDVPGPKTGVPLPIPGTDLCSAEAVSPGYRATYSPQPSSDPILVTLHPIEQTEGYSVSATSGLAPEESRKTFDKGMDAMKDEVWKDAEKSFQQAVQLYDRYAEAWYQLGKTYRELEKPDEARAALLKAVEADPRYEYPFEELYQLAFERDDMEDLLQQTDTLLRLNPFDFPGAYYYNAVANLQLKHYAAGEERIRKAIQDDPDHEQPMSYYVLGFLLANQGKSAEALGAFDVFLALQPKGVPADQAHAARETLQKRLQSRKPAGDASQ